MSKREFTPYEREVKHKLIELNMTQVELAKQIGCSRQYLHRILEGSRSGAMYIDDINQILGITFKS